MELYQRRRIEQLSARGLVFPGSASDRHAHAGAVGADRRRYLRDCTFSGPALPEPFVQFELAASWLSLGCWSRATTETSSGTGARCARQLRSTGGPQSVCNHVVAPLAECLGFDPPARQDDVATREGMEDGGWLMQAPCGARLRAWSLAADTDLDAPHRTGRAYRFSPMRSAQRVLLASGERLGLLTDGEELRLLLCDPARAGQPRRDPARWAAGMASAVSWRRIRIVWCWRLPRRRGIAALPDLLDAARLSQTRVTKDLRLQARDAIEGFLQAVLDNPANAADARTAPARGRAMGRGADPRLPPAVHPEAGKRGRSGVRVQLRLHQPVARTRCRRIGRWGRWCDGSSITVTTPGACWRTGCARCSASFATDCRAASSRSTPLGGALFGAEATPLLDRLAWGERAVALLLDRLLWTTPKGRARERVHYGSLDVEDLGRVYEALLELEPGITTAPMSRLRRAKLEVVLPAEHAAQYRGKRCERRGHGVTWVEDIPAGRFFLRAGVGRKTTGSYYTPHAFVRFLVRETLAPQITARSPDADPNPAAILALKVVDPATGSGHFLVEACRYLAEALYAACRMCDEGAAAAEDEAERASPDDRARLLARAAELRQRVADLPDPDGLLLAYLPSRASEGGASGVSQSRALAICRRLVAVHCLYGVDSNRLAIELAKLSLWLESYAEGLPLTFLDHRLVHGDSIARTVLRGAGDAAGGRQGAGPAAGTGRRERG